MEIGYLGKDAKNGVIFEVSDQTVRTLSKWKWSGSARYAVHQRHLGNALTEFTGLDPDKITFDIILRAELGVNPLKEIWRLFDYERQGVALALTVGKHGYGRYRWNIVSHSTDIDSTDPEGDISAAVISLTLQEYLKK